ncbi:MAG: acetylxylan esterase, partial [Bryobacteraceae bacterium]
MGWISFAALVCATAALAQIDTGIVEKHRAELEKQAVSAELRRQGGTQPQDWPYTLPEGVSTRTVTFYSDGTACYGKVFFPRGFHSRAAWPAVVLGHGFNAISIGIEKYGARFAERGLVAMAIDYRTYGFSSGQVRLLDPDPSSDTRPEWQGEARIELKRTRLNAFRQAEDYRAAISYLQGEPGVDRERIGVWGSSHAGGVVLTVAGQDARVKAVVAQVSGVAGRNVTGPAALPPNLAEDAIRRARTGQGAEIDGGFSFRTKIDLETTATGREHRPWAALSRIPETTAILWLPAEKDELINPRSPTGPFEASKAFRGISQVIEIPSITHFQAYSGPAFEVGSTLAADWLAKYLGSAAAAPKPRIAAARRRARAVPAAAGPLPEGVTTADANFYSEGVRCYARIFRPKGSTGKSAAVVLAPGWGETSESVAGPAARLAARGVVA